MTLADYKARLIKLLQDGVNALDERARDEMITQALQQRYSKDRPLEKVTDVDADGTSYLPLPNGWEDGFSFVKAIEYPIGEVPPSLIDAADWQMYRLPASVKILLLATTPNAAEKLRVTWAARHSADGATVYAGDFDAVCDYAAALAFEALAATYAQSGDSTIAADAVNYGSKSSDYLKLATAARKRYFDHVGVSGAGDAQGASGGLALGFGDMNENMGSGVDRLTHRRPR